MIDAVLTVRLIMTGSGTVLAILKPPRDGINARRSICVRARAGELYLALVGLIACVLATSAVCAGAGCKDDCRNEYVSALNDCRTEYEGGQQDLQDLEDCLADTRSEYDDCIDDCTSTGAGGVVACSAGVRALRLISFTAASIHTK
jgi:hypothetical protein